MPTTTFIAVQCCQCATMQVKQQKKSNKWICVVCNQKQSVRKVYAQGFMAKDVRQFVQSFNMARKLADEQRPDETLDPVYREQIDDQFSRNQRKRRNDWSDYLDLDDDRDDKLEESGDQEGDLESKVVTVLPMEILKKPKLKNYLSDSKTEGSKDLIRPIFAKRNSPSHHIVRQAKEPRQSLPTMRKGTSKYSDYPIEDEKEPKSCQPTKGMAASKWNDYIIPDEDDLELISGKDNEDQMGNWSNGVLQTLLKDQTVEEDIHPDFK